MGNLNSFIKKNNEIIYNYICPYIVIEDNGEYYLKNRTKVDIFVPYDVKLKKYKFEKLYYNLTLPVNVHAAISYEYVNRYRHEEYKKLLIKREENKFNKFEITLAEAKQALAEKFGCLAKNICIKL